MGRLILVAAVGLMGAAGDTGYSNTYRATVRADGKTIICNTVAVWESRDEIEVTDCVLPRDKVPEVQ